MFQMKRRLKTLSEDWAYGIMTYTQYIESVVLCIAEAKRDHETASWLCDAFVDKICKDDVDGVLR